MNVPEIHREIAHAWVDGAEVEQWCDRTQSWLSCSLLPSFSASKYRLKPIPHSIDWSHVNERYIALVVNKTGAARLVTKTPSRGPIYAWTPRQREHWYLSVGSEGIDAENFTSFKRGTVSWDESLVFRPSKEMCAEPVKVDGIGLTAEQWAQIPSEYNWIAKDQDGYWYAYESEPESEYDPKIDYGAWEEKGPDTLTHPWPITTRLPGLLPNLQGSGLWEDCLIERPSVEAKEYVGLTTEQWEEIPSKYDWVAMDEDGDWYAYCGEPRICSDNWLPGGGSTESQYIARPGDLDCSRVAWRDSLTKRPSTPEGFSWSRWGGISPRMKFIAKDRSGDWYAYESEPELIGDSWMAHGQIQHIYSHAPPDIPWESSLQHRP